MLKFLKKLKRFCYVGGWKKKFGVTLLHRHFDVGPEEKMVEQFDAGSRQLVISVMKIPESANGLVPAVFKFTKN